MIFVASYSEIRCVWMHIEMRMLARSPAACAASHSRHIVASMIMCDHIIPNEARLLLVNIVKDEAPAWLQIEVNYSYANQSLTITS